MKDMRKAKYANLVQKLSTKLACQHNFDAFLNLRTSSLNIDNVRAKNLSLLRRSQNFTLTQIENQFEFTNNIQTNSVISQ